MRFYVNNRYVGGAASTKQCWSRGGALDWLKRGYDVVDINTENQPFQQLLLPRFKRCLNGRQGLDKATTRHPAVPS
jgi:hypothetical protein